MFPRPAELGFTLSSQDKVSQFTLKYFISFCLTLPALLRVGGTGLYRRYQGSCSGAPVTSDAPPEPKHKLFLNPDMYPDQGRSASPTVVMITDSR